MANRRRAADDDESTGPNPYLLTAGVVVVLVGALVWWFTRSESGAQVTGVVTLDDQPVAGARIVFIGENTKFKTPITAQSKDDGGYRLGNVGTGVPVGTYKVAVEKIALKDGTVPVGELLEKARSDGLLMNILPTQYETVQTTPLQFEVRAGANKILLELKKK